MIQHGYVPSDFLKGIISPIVKDAEGDATALDNYRGITLSHVFAYLFEHAMLVKIDHLLYTDNLQFGYKKRNSTSHAIYTVRKCIDYFRSNNSNLFVAFLDCTKGFDRVSHDGIFIKMIEREIPLCWIRILVYWYSNLISSCKWQNAFSDFFSVASGVRQGGVLSAKIFAIYMDGLVLALRNTKYGCHIADIFIASVLYADDLCLLAPTREAMQILLDTCSEYAEYWCIKYNDKKSKLMFFGKKPESFTCAPVYLNNNKLDFVLKWNYLGIVIQSGDHFSCSSQKCLGGFYRSVNTILNTIRKPSEDVMMNLLYSVCIPIITYASDVTLFSSKELTRMHVAANDAVRKIFTYNRWESVKILREGLGFPSITEIFASRRKSFELYLPQLGNPILISLSQL